MRSHFPQDADVAAWVEAQPRQLTYSELATACLQQFGPERAWDADRLQHYWQNRLPTLSRSPIEQDPKILAFLRDRVGRLTVDEMLAQCRTVLGRERVPSRSAVYRWTLRERRRVASCNTDNVGRLPK